MSTRVSMILLFFSLAGLLAWAVVGFEQKEFSEEEIGAYRTQTAQQREGYLKELIERKGGSVAHEAFARLIEGETANTQHTEAHLFGGALYAVLGEEGLAICDTRFLYGCFHEFLGRAIGELGVEATEKMNEACVRTLGEKAHFCQHGIGHGVQAHFGYDDTALDQALSICGSLPSNDPVGGCLGGLFMEYNLRTMLAEAAVARESEDPFNPCERLDNRYLRACHFWQPQWWLQGKPATPEIAAQMGSYCERMNPEKPQFRRDCFEGMANLIAPALDYDIARGAELCNASSLIPEHQTICRYKLVRRSVVGLADRVDPSRCQGLPNSELERCRVLMEDAQ